MDPRAEQRVFDQIRNLAAEGQTIILITHRLHSVRHADEIYVLDYGRIAEHGTFEHLMRTDGDGPGLFRRMYLVQSEQYRLDEHSLPRQNATARKDHETESTGER
jgi:ATP-binding cassette subfamily B protein